MADISDVLTGIVNSVAGGIYPNGTGQASATGYQTRLYPGWPVKTQLDSDLTAGYVNISVYPLPTERMESLINLDATVESVAAPGVALSVSGNQITVSGTPKVGDVACVNRNRNPYTYVILTGDTIAVVATALAGLIGGTVSGSVVTAPAGTFVLSTLVSTPAVALQPMRRISRQVQVSVWASTPASRDATAKLVESTLFQSEWITMPDATLCGITYGRAPIDDFLQKDNLFRRDLIVSADFVETYTFNAQTVADIVLNASTATILNDSISVTPVVTFNVGV